MCVPRFSTVAGKNIHGAQRPPNAARERRLAAGCLVPRPDKRMGEAQASDFTTEPLRFNPAVYVCITTSVSSPASRAVRLSMNMPVSITLVVKFFVTAAIF